MKPTLKWKSDFIFLLGVAPWTFSFLKLHTMFGLLWFGTTEWCLLPYITERNGHTIWPFLPEQFYSALWQSLDLSLNECFMLSDCSIFGFYLTLITCNKFVLDQSTTCTPLFFYTTVEGFCSITNTVMRTAYAESICYVPLLLYKVRHSILWDVQCIFIHA